MCTSNLKPWFDRIHMIDQQLGSENSILALVILNFISYLERPLHTAYSEVLLFIYDYAWFKHKLNQMN